MRRTTLAFGIAGALGGILALPSSAQIAIPETYALPTSAADASKPGFLWNMFHNPANQVNENNRTEDALAGRLVDGEGVPLENLADPAAVGAASGAGVKLGTAANALLQFIIPGVINFDQAAGSNGSITPDEQMPGIPGVGDTLTDEGIAAEVLTWLDLSVGSHTFIVNSDDGFTLRIGGAAPTDPLNAVFVGEFNGGRGAADTTMQVNITKAGLYATRVTWEEGGGGANVEFVEVKADDTRAAVNSPESTIKAYRAVTTALPTFVTSAIPVPNTTTATYDTPVNIDLFGPSVTQASVTLSLDGSAVTPTVTKTGDTVAIRYQPTGRFAPKSKHTILIGYNDGQAKTLTYDFTVTDYALLTAAMKVTPDTAKPGFIWEVHQNTLFQANDNRRPLDQLAGLLGPNLADKDAVGAALAPGVPGATDRLPIRFEIATVINVDQAAGSNGEFTPDEQMPGIPGLGESGNDEGIAAAITTYIELQAGVLTMTVNSDDGFRTTAGNLRDVFDASVAGEFIGGRGAVDSTFRVVVEEAGVYAFRTVWEEGGGGANIEWKTDKADGSRALINDSANGGLKAYRALAAGQLEPTAVTSVSPAPGQVETAQNANIQIVIVDGSTTVDTASVALALDGTTVTPTVGKTAGVTTITYDPPADFAIPSTHTARLTFTAGTQRVEDWSFSVPPLTRDKVDGKAGFIVAGAKFTANSGGRSGQPGDYAMDFGTGAGTVHVTDASFTRTPAADDTLTIAYDQKLHQVQNASAFWLNSPTANNSTRGFQAHTPWGDATIYFDTSGCCTADTQRISQNISEYSNYSGTAAWWEDWHHFAFVKDTTSKRIYIDGNLFLEGSGADALYTDFTDLIIGGGPGVADNRIAGVLDNFVVYNAALTEAQVDALASGTAPTAVTGNPGLLAWWDFNDASTTGPGPTLSIARSGLTVTVTFTGTLQSTTSLGTAFTPVANATSPYTVNTTTAAATFFRAAQ